VWEIIEAAGWPIWPLIATSVYGFAIILERAWALRASKIMPGHLFDTVHLMLRQGVIKKEKLDELKGSSPFGEIIFTALKNKDASLEVLKDSIEESAGLVAHKLETNINALGTISTVAPLLGLFGTIVGMVELFSSFTSSGHDVAVFARGISAAQQCCFGPEDKAAVLAAVLWSIKPRKRHNPGCGAILLGLSWGNVVVDT